MFLDWEVWILLAVAASFVPSWIVIVFVLRQHRNRIEMLERQISMRKNPSWWVDICLKDPLSQVSVEIGSNQKVNLRKRPEDPPA